MTIFTGYFCKSKQKEEGYGHTLCLCKSRPISHRPSGVDWMRVPDGDVFLVPKGSSDIVVDDEDFWDAFEPGKRYRVTIDEIEDE